MANQPPYYDVYNPNYPRYGEPLRARRRFGTSPMELLHLLLATVVLTTAIVIWLQFWQPQKTEDLELWQLIIVATGIVVTGFVLHEVAHKITAQHYGHWSEFRSSMGGLAFTLLLAIGLKMLFGAPGATWHTATSVKDNGKISAAGPFTNLVIALIAFPFTGGVTGDEALPNVIADGVLVFNTFLAIFNLIPLGPLDGRKILRWNPVVYGILVALTILLIVYANPFQGFLE